MSGGGGDFSSLFRAKTGPGVHSASYKMCTGRERRPSIELAIYLFLVPWLCRCGLLHHPHPPGAFMACNGDTITFYLKILLQVQCPKVLFYRLSYTTFNADIMTILNINTFLENLGQSGKKNWEIMICRRKLIPSTIFIFLHYHNFHIVS